MNEPKELYKELENICKEKLVQIEREVRSIELRVEELPVEVVGYYPLQKVRRLKESIQDSIREMEN